MNMPEKIDALCSGMERELSISSRLISTRLIRMSEILYKLVDKKSDSVKEYAADKIRRMAVQTEKRVLKVWLYSVMMGFTNRIELVEEFLTYIIQEDRFRPETKYFLYYQIEAATFRKARLDNENIKYLKWELLKNIVASFKETLKEYLDYIPYNERKMDTAIVICGQILEAGHAPTMIAVEKCKFLTENMHMKVLLVNTAEALSGAGSLQYFGALEGNYIDELLYKDFIEWKGTRIPFFQCENNMPNTNDLSALLQMVHKVKPGLIMEIGTSSIFANLADNIIPVLTYGTVGDVKSTMTRCQTLTRNLREEDVRLLDRAGIRRDSIIEIPLQMTVQKQMKKMNRKKLGLPEEKFILAIVGNRLDAEIDERFMRMLAGIVLDSDIAVAVIGEFRSYKKYVQEFPELLGKVFFLGRTNDLQAWLENCDLFINPYRAGGGTSGIYALMKGVPVITAAFGDVSVCAGDEFCTDSYVTMPDLIRKYKNDREFYLKKSELAKERAKLLISSTDTFVNVVEEFQNRIRDEQL